MKEQQSTEHKDSDGIDVGRAIGEFGRMANRVGEAIRTKAAKYDNEEGHETFAAFMEALGANVTGGPLYCRWNMREQMQVLKRKERMLVVGAIKNGVSIGGASLAETLDAYVLVLAFVEAIVFEEVGA